MIDPLYPFEKYINIAKEHSFKDNQGDGHTINMLTMYLLQEILQKRQIQNYTFQKYEGYDYDANFVEDDDLIHFGKIKTKSDSHSGTHSGKY